MLQAVELPAGIAHLDTGLADMYRDTFTLVWGEGGGGAKLERKNKSKIFKTRHKSYI